MSKPHSPSCDRNKEPILEVLKKYLTKGRLLEVGSGTGQHAVHIAPNFLDVEWVTSDVRENHSGIELWLEEVSSENIKGPIPFEVGKDDFPEGHFDYIFTANSLHIMSWELVQKFIALLGEHTKENLVVLIYGPFNYNGQFTSEGNKGLEKWLKDRDPLSGIRDFEKVYELMIQAGFELTKDHEMPANNRLLAFTKKG